MSFLLAVLVPALLMLATLGLSRLEAGLVRDTVTRRDVAHPFEQPDAGDARALARVGAPEALPVKPGGVERAAQAFRVNR